ncbi:MAG: hypothetical protein ACK4HG_14310, partial [Agrobacterium albertimagni]
NPKVGQQNQHRSQFLGSCLNQSGRPCGAALSFGEAAYTATPTNRQQPDFTKVQKIDMPLIFLRLFRYP